MVEMLRLAGVLPAGGSRVEVGRVAARLVRDVIGRLRPAEDATYRERMAYSVLDVCFLKGAKADRAADVGHLCAPAQP